MRLFRDSCHVASRAFVEVIFDIALVSAIFFFLRFLGDEAGMQGQRWGQGQGQGQDRGKGLSQEEGRVRVESQAH